MKHLNLCRVSSQRFGRPREAAAGRCLRSSIWATGPIGYAMNIELTWLVAFVLCVLAPSFGDAESTMSDAAESHRQAAPRQETRANPHGKPAPRSSQQGSSKTHNAAGRSGRAVTTAPNTRSAASNTRAATHTTALNSAALMQTHPATPAYVAAAPHFTSNGLKPNTAAAVPSTGVGRRALGAGIIGGPAKYDARHGAIMGGTVTGRKR